MTRTLMTSLTIILLTGNSWAENILFQGPIYGSQGEQVEFNTSISPLMKIQTIVWSFENVNIITSIDSGSVTVGSEYKDRVVLNQTTGALKLQSLRLNDTGSYTVILSPADGTQTLQGRTDLQVFVPVTGVNIKGPNSTLVEGKSSANLNCDGNGTITTTQWIKDVQHLSESDTITFSADNRSLLINPVNRSDIGEYVCVRSNPISSGMANHSITVLYGPDVKILGAEILEEGSDILLYCSVSSVPLASLTWTINDVDAGNSALYIRRSSNSDHSGIYTCTASNHMTGLRKSAQHTVTVRGTSNKVLSPGEIAGIVVGVVLVLLLAISVFFNFRNVKGSTGEANRESALHVREPEARHGQGTQRQTADQDMMNMSKQPPIRDRVMISPFGTTDVNIKNSVTELHVYEECDLSNANTYANQYQMKPTT